MTRKCVGSFLGILLSCFKKRIHSYDGFSYRALDEGANVNTVCRDSGVSASHIAAHLGHTAILQHLLSAGAKPKSDFKGRHPIHLAAWRGHLSVLEILVKGDVDVKVEPPKCEDLQATSLDSWDHYHCSINQTVSTKYPLAFFFYNMPSLSITAELSEDCGVCAQILETTLVDA